VACAPTVLALDWALPSAIDDDLRGASASIAVDALGRRCIEDPTTGVNPWNETH
jgi:hypothetical protein